MNASAPSLPRSEKPSNGLKGLRHWRHDLLAGLVVSFVSLPLSSGIAIASGAPAIYGIISSVIAGLVFPFLGGSYVTISGPAAGLAPALLATMAALGGAGDANHVGAGYPFLLVVISAVGVIQIIGARLKLARFAAVFPVSVVEGMLGAIGVLILIKALPLALGYLEPIHAHGFVEYIEEIPTWVAGADLSAVGIAAACLGVFWVLGLPSVRSRAPFHIVPPHVFAVALGVIGGVMLKVDAAQLISVPSNPLDGVQLPDFGGLIARPELWKAAAVGMLTLLLIDGVESLATAQAIDRIDPFKRRSEPNRVLGAMGVSNLVSSLLGGLTVIPGGVKSKTCIEAGGRTLWTNFVNALLLLGYLFIAPGLVAMIPKAALGAVLVYTGWKMIHPRIGRHLMSIGNEQLALYVLTIFAMLATDLLVGIAVGTALKLLFVSRTAIMAGGSEAPRGLLGAALGMFRDPVVGEHLDGEVLTLEVNRPLVCFNAYKLLERLDRRPEHIAKIIVSFGSGTTVVDHTGVDGVLHALDVATPETIEVRGLERMRSKSNHAAAMRILLPGELERDLSISGG